MTVSARSQLTFGIAAILTATTVGVAGVTATGLELPSTRAAAHAEVQLAALVNPLLEIYDTIQKTNYFLFSIAEPPLLDPPTTLTRAGIVPEFLAAGFPILTQYFLNAPDYVNQAINYVFADQRDSYEPPLYQAVYPGALRILTWAVDALPANIGYAAQQLSVGNFVGALETAKRAVLNPIQAALYQTLNAGLYAIAGVGARAAAAVTAVAEWIPKTIRNLADDVTVVTNAVFNVVANIAYGFQSGNLENAWNSLVVGLLGTQGDWNLPNPTIPDALIDQTIGGGGRIYQDPSLPAYQEVPSIRQNVTELRDALAGALATAVPDQNIPPFPVSRFPFFANQIPTPWQPTPYVPPVPPPFAAMVSTPASATNVSAEAATSAKAVRASRAARAVKAANSTAAKVARNPGAATR
ncbi:MAG: hypothetical protein ACR2JI_03060 [Mycobacterium sp.]